VVGYIGHYDSLSFLDTWMPFCVTKYYHVFVSFNLLCLNFDWSGSFTQEDRQIHPNTSNRRSFLERYHASNTLIIYIIGNYSNNLSRSKIIKVNFQIGKINWIWNPSTVLSYSNQNKFVIGIFTGTKIRYIIMKSFRSYEIRLT
jgi:hypothetical protein